MAVRRGVRITEAVRMRVNMEAETGGRNMEKIDRIAETIMIALVGATQAEEVVEMMLTLLATLEVAVVEMMINVLDTREGIAVEMMINPLDTREAAADETMTVLLDTQEAVAVKTMTVPLDTQVEEATAETIMTKEAETILADRTAATMTTTVDMINAHPGARVVAMAEIMMSRDVKKQSATIMALVAEVPMTDQVDMVVTTAVRQRAEAVAMQDMEATRARTEASSLLGHPMEALVAMVEHLMTIPMLLSMLNQTLVTMETLACLVWLLVCSTRTRQKTRTLTKMML